MQFPGVSRNCVEIFDRPQRPPDEIRLAYAFRAVITSMAKVKGSQQEQNMM